MHAGAWGGLVEPVTSPGQWQEQLDQPRSGQMEQKLPIRGIPGVGQSGKKSLVPCFSAGKTGGETRGSQCVP